MNRYIYIYIYIYKKKYTSIWFLQRGACRRQELIAMTCLERMCGRQLCLCKYYSRSFRESLIHNAAAVEPPL